MDKPVVLLTGPTASGKSALALALASRLESAGGAVIINADSMQVYRELRILTARPSAADESLVPHRLYGLRPADSPWSVAAFRAAAAQEIADAEGRGSVPILVGGTGLYLKGLLDGIANIPPIPDAIREAARARLQGGGPMALHRDLAAHDPETAATLRPTDSQRLTRAWEVLEATGRSLSSWQRETGAPVVPRERCLCYVVETERPALYDRIDRRFRRMIEEGAVDEVEALLAQGLAGDLPVMRAVGVPQVAAFLRAEIDRETMIAQGSQATRNLAKRQLTWARNQMSSWDRVTQDSEIAVEKIFAKIRQ